MLGLVFFWVSILQNCFEDNGGEHRHHMYLCIDRTPWASNILFLSYWRASSFTFDLSDYRIQ